MIEKGGKAEAAVVMGGEGITMNRANQCPFWGGGREVDVEMRLGLYQ